MFQIIKGEIRQGRVLAPYLFNTVKEAMNRTVKRKLKDKAKMLIFADNLMAWMIR